MKLGNYVGMSMEEWRAKHRQPAGAKTLKRRAAKTHAKRKVRTQRGEFVQWRIVPPDGRLLTPAPGWNTLIYALIDPRDGGVRYVGSTVNTLAERVRRHMEKPTNREMGAWIQGLVAGGYAIRAEVISYAPDGMAGNVEMNWIAQFRARGRLLNRDPGGQYRDETGKPKEFMQKVAGMYQRQVNRQVRGENK